MRRDDRIWDVWNITDMRLYSHFKWLRVYMCKLSMMAWHAFKSFVYARVLEKTKIVSNGTHINRINYCTIVRQITYTWFIWNIIYRPLLVQRQREPSRILEVIHDVSGSNLGEGHLSGIAISGGLLHTPSCCQISLVVMRTRVSFQMHIHYAYKSLEYITNMIFRDRLTTMYKLLRNRRHALETTRNIIRQKIHFMALACKALKFSTRCRISSRCIPSTRIVQCIQRHIF